MERVTFNTTAEFKKQLKIYAVLQKKTVTEIVHEALIKYLGEQKLSADYE